MIPETTQEINKVVIEFNSGMKAFVGDFTEKSKKQLRDFNIEIEAHFSEVENRQSNMVGQDLRKNSASFRKAQASRDFAVQM